MLCHCGKWILKHHQGGNLQFKSSLYGLNANGKEERRRRIKVQITEEWRYHGSKNLVEARNGSFFFFFFFAPFLSFS
jgi:hypothetical protein